MNRQEKEQVISSLQKDFTGSKSSFLVEYKGLTVNQVQSLRKELRQKGGYFRVAKARLMKRAVQNMEDAQQLSPYFKEQVGLVFAQEETPAVAKVLRDFSKKHDSLRLVVGFFESNVLDKQAVHELASLPSREVLLAQLCGTLNAPIQQLAGVLHVTVAQLLYTLDQVSRTKSE